jgi:deoxyribonuclease-4
MENYFYFGSTLSTAGKTFEELVNDAIKTHSSCFQFFAKNPKIGYDKIKFTESDIAAGVAIMKKNKLKCVIHGQYTHKLVYPKSILEELAFADKIGAIGVVLHANEISVSDFAKVLSRTIDKMVVRGIKSKILVENMANKSIFVKMDDFDMLYSLIPTWKHKYIGICYDTCHGFINETYDIRDTKITDFLFGKYKFECIHFNDADSKTQDMHANIFTGYLGNDNKGGNRAAFLYFAKTAVEHGVPMVTERVKNTDETKKSQNDSILELISGGNFKISDYE